MTKEFEENGNGFPFKMGGKTDTKTDCEYWGTVKYKFMTVPGCELSNAKHRYWCRFGCTNCSDYKQKKSEDS
jgi:hypothetical protein